MPESSGYATDDWIPLKDAVHRVADRLYPDVNGEPPESGYGDGSTERIFAAAQHITGRASS